MLTRKQLDLLNFINERMRKDGVPPSFDEMKDALDLRSKSGIHRLITALEERGFIRRLAHRARAIEIVKMPDMDGKAGFVPKVIEGDKAPAPKNAIPVEVHAVELPVMGRIAAGVPIEAISEEKMLPIPIPTPDRPITARPAPIIFAASSSMRLLPSRYVLSRRGFFLMGPTT